MNIYIFTNQMDAFLVNTKLRDDVGLMMAKGIKLCRLQLMVQLHILHKQWP